jgi:deazaflavin-dependent oxidoreductase (nitroreductase family)
MRPPSRSRRAVIEEFRANNGRITHEHLRHVRLVLLTTTGARTGNSHTTPLAYSTDGPDRIVLWASAMAASSHPDWYRNLVANPQVSVELITDANIVKRCKELDAASPVDFDRRV